MKRYRYGGACCCGPACAVSGNENKMHTFWGLYLMIVGASMVLIDPHDYFMLIRGGWEVFVGALCLILGPKWWGAYKYVDGDLA
jgi:hypothetical protein